MNEEMQDLTADTLGKVLEYVEATEGFVIEQAPLLCQEIVAWGFWSNALLAGLSLGVFGLVISLGVVIVRDGAKKDDTDEIGVGLVCCVVSIVPLAILSTFTLNAVKVCVAPRLYIIEELSKLL